MSNKTPIKISTYSGEIIRSPPGTNNLVSIYPLYYKRRDYETGFNHGWRSGDYAVQGPVGEKLFFNNKTDAFNHIFPQNKPERMPTRKIRGRVKLQERATVEKWLDFQAPSQIINTRNNLSFEVSKRVYNAGGNNFSPRTGNRFNPPILKF